MSGHAHTVLGFVSLIAIGYVIGHVLEVNFWLDRIKYFPKANTCEVPVNNI